MKKLVLSVLITFLAFQSFSQVDIISNNVYQNSKKLGIGTMVPKNWLTVVNDSNTIGMANNTSIAEFRRDYGNSIAKYQIYGYPNTTMLPEYLRSSIMLYSTSDAKNFKIAAAPVGGTIQFLAGGWDNSTYERMRITSEGNVGINTLEPASKLHIADGDIYISDINKGIIMKSPDGQCWRGVLDNSGELNFSKVTCPDGYATKANSQLNNEHVIEIFPNPTSNTINVKIHTDAKGLEYEIFNSNGQQVMSGKLKNNNSKINIGNLLSGAYLMKIKNKYGQEIDSAKILKK